MLPERRLNQHRNDHESKAINTRAQLYSVPNMLYYFDLRLLKLTDNRYSFVIKCFRTNQIML